MPSIITKAPTRFANERIKQPPLLINGDGQNITDVAQWEPHRQKIVLDWKDYLGTPPFDPFPLNAQVIRTDDYDTHKGTLVALQTEPNYSEQCYLMTPDPLPDHPLPAVVVFFYDVDTPAGYDMGSPRWKEDNETRRFARHLVERGYVTLVQRWVYEGKEQLYPSTEGRYSGPVAHHHDTFPEWKGLGRVVSDASICVDYLETLDFVDSNRIGCMGHSLGGKMTLYAAAFDERFKVAVGSDFGIGLSYCNWDAPWYLGPEVRSDQFPRDHHQLLGLIAPRPFLLIAGESSDGDKSWPYLNAAQDVYALYDVPDRVGMYNHRSGHSPTMDACFAAYDWFDRYLARSAVY